MDMHDISKILGDVASTRELVTWLCRANTFFPLPADSDERCVNLHGVCASRDNRRRRRGQRGALEVELEQLASNLSLLTKTIGSHHLELEFRTDGREGQLS